MKIHITKAGNVIIICFIIIIVLFFMFGGAAVVAKIVENHRVNSLPSVANVFSNSDISYNNWSSLKSSFRARHSAVSKFLQRANDLKQSYPQNDALASKIQNYGSYLSSMNEASFECPEHINTGIEHRYRTCSKCNGTGKRFWVLKCKACNGSGEIAYDAKIVKNCPYCGTTYKSQISGNSLLN